MDWAALLFGHILAVLVRNPGAGLLSDHPALLPLRGHTLLLVQGVALHGLHCLAHLGLRLYVLGVPHSCLLSPAANLGVGVARWCHWLGGSSSSILGRGGSEWEEETGKLKAHLESLNIHKVMLESTSGNTKSCCITRYKHNQGLHIY